MGLLAQCTRCSCSPVVDPNIFLVTQESKTQLRQHFSSLLSWFTVALHISFFSFFILLGDVIGIYNFVCSDLILFLGIFFASIFILIVIAEDAFDHIDIKPYLHWYWTSFCDHYLCLDLNGVHLHEAEDAVGAGSYLYLYSDFRSYLHFNSWCCRFFFCIIFIIFIFFCCCRIFSLSLSRSSFYLGAAAFCHYFLSLSLYLSHCCRRRLKMQSFKLQLCPCHRSLPILEQGWLSMTVIRWWWP